MRDVYVEWLVARKRSAGFKVLKVLCIALTVVCAAMFLLYLNLILMLGTILLAVLAYFVNLYTYVEYEYIFVSGELTIDRILSKSKRKRLETYKLSQVEIIAPMGSPKLDGYKHKQYQAHDYSSGNIAEGNRKNLYVMYHNTGVKLLLEPSKELLEAFKGCIPHKIEIEM